MPVDKPIKPCNHDRADRADIRYLRNSLGMSTEKLSREFKCSRSTVHRALRNDRSPPDNIDSDPEHVRVDIMKTRPHMGTESLGVNSVKSGLPKKVSLTSHEAQSATLLQAPSLNIPRKKKHQIARLSSSKEESRARGATTAQKKVIEPNSTGPVCGDIGTGLDVRGWLGLLGLGDLVPVFKQYGFETEKRLDILKADPPVLCRSQTTVDKIFQDGFINLQQYSMLTHDLMPGGARPNPF